MVMAAAGAGARQGRLGAGVGPAQSCEPVCKATTVNNANIVSADVFSKERGVLHCHCSKACLRCMWPDTMSCNISRVTAPFVRQSDPMSLVSIQNK
eukprot:6338749-Lingulodinium_polyedra.AAC.1